MKQKAVCKLGVSIVLFFYVLPRTFCRFDVRSQQRTSTFDEKACRCVQEMEEHELWENDDHRAATDPAEGSHYDCPL
jgi:dsDNA-specific endonuclease/ATPase MutS2